VSLSAADDGGVTWSRVDAKTMWGLHAVTSVAGRVWAIGGGGAIIATQPG
jgi:hypothetical protein